MRRGSRDKPCQDALGSLPHTRSPLALPRGGVEGHPAATTEGQKIEVVWGHREGTPAGASLGYGLAGADPRSPTSPSPAHPRRRQMGHAKKWPQGHCHPWVPRHDLALAHGHSGSPWRGRAGVTHGSGGEDRRGKVGLPPLIPPQQRKGPAPNLQAPLTPSPGRGWKVVDNKTNKKNVGHVIDC